jgi:hypothetical protein
VGLLLFEISSVISRVVEHPESLRCFSAKFSTAGTLRYQNKPRDKYSFGITRRLETKRREKSRKAPGRRGMARTGPSRGQGWLTSPTSDLEIVILDPAGGVPFMCTVAEYILEMSVQRLQSLVPAHESSHLIRKNPDAKLERHPLGH